MARPFQLYVRGPDLGEGRVRLLHQPFAIIGRDDRADVVLDHKMISRRHLYIQVVESHAFWVDMDSRSGTISSGHAQKCGWLEQGDAICIAGFEVQHIRNDEATPGDGATGKGPRISPFLARSYVCQVLPEVSLEFLNGPSRTACWPMNRVMSLVGSAEGSKFRLADPSVSPFHCSLLRTSAGLWVIDLLSQDGVTVNDVAVRFAMLTDGDVVRVGKYRIRFRIRFADVEADVPTRPDGGSNRHGASRVQDHHSTSSAPQVMGVTQAVSSIHVNQLFNTEQALGSESSRPFGVVSRSGWSASNAMDFVRIENPELTESVLVPLLNQFGSMQQQMLDQFQQAISVLVQMFSSVHKDQMGVIREELDQLRNLTREIEQIKNSIISHSKDYAEKPMLPEAAPLATQVGDRTVHDLLQQDPSQADQGLIDLETSRVVPPESLPGDPLDGIATGRLRLDESSIGHGESDKATAKGEGQHAQLPTIHPGRQANRDVIWLNERMISLQQERETRWQKILKLLPGL
jgi:pSer/pThr/pTyr-binding forkhead associated (FHA) protein